MLGQLDLRGMPFDVIARELDERGFARRGEKNDYDYLLKMPMMSMTAEKAREMRKDFKSAKRAHEDVSSISAEDMWRAALSAVKDAVAPLLG